VQTCACCAKNIRVDRSRTVESISRDLHVCGANGLRRSSSSLTKIIRARGQTAAGPWGLRKNFRLRGRGGPGRKLFAEPSALFQDYTGNLNEQNGSCPATLLAGRDFLERGERLRLRRTTYMDIDGWMLLERRLPAMLRLHPQEKEEGKQVDQREYTAEADKITVPTRSGRHQSTGPGS